VPFALLTSKVAQFREDFHLVVARVEVFGGESLAAPWALPATPIQDFRAADIASLVVAGSAEQRDESETEPTEPSTL
jgi:hypothetical protein